MKKDLIFNFIILLHYFIKIHVHRGFDGDFLLNEVIGILELLLTFIVSILFLLCEFLCNLDN